MPVDIEGNKDNSYSDDDRVKRSHEGPYLLPVFTHLVTAIG